MMRDRGQNSSADSRKALIKAASPPERSEAADPRNGLMRSGVDCPPERSEERGCYGVTKGMGQALKLAMRRAPGVNDIGGATCKDSDLGSVRR
ncbi:jg25081 [Pararge aegeria aegeria]|uniref:Jg25081 protein n=1 Tax=Pararge aegeria aegeria TaxID=348720 RepID=A0A8S4QN87_9NEOP|nr:jg25081 [Pararge aegeria aegeria]